MIRNFSIFLIPVVVFLFYLAFAKSEPEAPVTEPDPEEWVMDDDLAAYLDQFEQKFEQGMNDKRIPGASVVIVKEGRVVFQKGFGVSRPPA